MLPKRTLGKTDLKVTQLGYGSMGLQGPATWGVRVVEDEAADQFLNLVLDSGINFIDTSPDYGVSEERIGRFIGSRRKGITCLRNVDVTMFNKDHLEVLHTWSSDVLKRNIETSLQRLQTDYIDYSSFTAAMIHGRVNRYPAGRIRFIGSSSSLPHLPGMIELDVFDTIQMPYSCLAPRHHDWITKAAESGAGIIYMQKSIDLCLMFGLRRH